jgi:hypothetical protein
MSRFLLPLALAAAAAAVFVCATPGHAQSLTCRTVDGNTVCAGPDALGCQTVNGKTVCAQGTTSCRSARDKDGCSKGLPTAKQRDDMPADDADDDADDDSADPPQGPAGSQRGRRL